MEPSVEEGFSFLDLEDCDVEARQYLETIIERSPTSARGHKNEPNDFKPSDVDETSSGATTSGVIHSKNVSTTKLSERAVSSSSYYPTDPKSSGEKHVVLEGSHNDRNSVTRASRVSTTERETIVATNYEASINVALSSRGSIRGIQQPPAFQTPTHLKMRPAQQTAAAGSSTYLPGDASQMSSNPIPGNSAVGGFGANVPSSYHQTANHQIQQQQHNNQQAYAAAAAAAAANVQQQHAASQQTPYVFINQVTANVNVHHGPVANGNNQQHQAGVRDAGNNGGITPGPNQPPHLQHSPGMAIMPNQTLACPPLQGTPPTGMHPIHMQPGQMGTSNGMLPQSMNQPPPHQTNVPTSLAASGIASGHPSGALLPPMMANNFQLAHQNLNAIPYNAIPSRTGALSSQQPPATPNAATMMSMQQLHQMYGYPIYIPNVPSQVPPYGHTAPIHAMPQPQLPQGHPHLQHMTQVQQAPLNVQPSLTQRQGVHPLPSAQAQPIILRNPLSPPAMQPIANPNNSLSGILVSQQHQKPINPTVNQRPSFIPHVSTNPMGASHNTVTQPTVPNRMVPAMTTLQNQSQLNPQAAFFPNQQSANIPLPTSTPLSAINPSDSFQVPQQLENRNVPQDVPVVNTSQRPTPNYTSSASAPKNVTEQSNITSEVNNTQEATNIGFEEDDESCKASSNDEPSSHDEEGLAFGTVDIKSLVAQGDVTAFHGETSETMTHYSEDVDSSAGIPTESEIQNMQKDGIVNHDIDSMALNVEATKGNKDETADGTSIGDDKNPSIESSDQPTKKPTWASLFKSSSSMAGAGVTHIPSSNDSIYLSEGKPTARIQPYKESLNESVDSTAMASQCGSNDMAFSGKDVEMGNYLKDYSMNHRAPSIKPRGLSNRSNWCFVNAILQALVACPPFYNLMKSLPKDLLVLPSSESEQANNPSVKILRAVYHFFSEFSPLDNFPKLNHRSKNKKNEDLPLGKILEPTTIYNFLLGLDSDTFKVIEGRQEDAEEFLTFLLNGLNDEMISLLKLVEQERENSIESDESVGRGSYEKDEEDENDEEWREVGPRGTKSCVTRRVEQKGSGTSAKSPLAEMFQGQMRSQVQHSNEEPTATLQPFLTLQLDIQSDKIRNVGDAIACNFAEESIDGYMCSKTNQEIEASRSMSLEELPPILVLHLKRFIYDGSSNGCQKLLKNIDFPVDLEINKDILSTNSRNKYPTKQRQYKLFAVVYHNGSEATKGHYVTDIYHTGLSSWLRCDDSILKTQTESMVLAHSATSVPYILFYRRADTMLGGSVNERSGTKNTSSGSNTNKT